MSKLKAAQFVDLVKRSGLVDDERLNQALSGVDESVKDSGIIASAFTKAGLLTEWQSEKLLQGKHKGFYLGKYKLLSHLGTGGMGAVYLAEHRVMRHRVAIKLLPGNLAAHTSYLERFHQEARASAQLNHPNMVRAFDVDEDENHHFLVMEYVDGQDLQVIVSRQGPLSYHMAADYTRQAAEGLAYAHRVGLIHRDIKPANLLVDKTGTVKILDMGLARFSDESQGSLTMAYDQKMIGTVDYLAPEQALDSHKVDQRVDIYSLGCTLYYMLSGDAPFPQGTIPQRLMQHQKEEPADIRKNRPDAPSELLAICKKMMAKSADHRYQSGDEVVAALTDYLGDADSRPNNAPPAAKLPPLGPSLNEDLDLAPLEDEPVHSIRRPASDSKAGSHVTTGSKGSGITGSDVKKGGSSIIKAGPGSGVPGKPASGLKPPGKSGIKGGVTPPAPAPRLPELDRDKDLMDELLAAPSVPAEPKPLQLPPSRKPQHSASGFHLWIVLGIALGATCAIAGAIYGLLWFADSIGL